MNLFWLFNKTINMSYIHVENSGDYAVQRYGSTLYIFLESSNGYEDWKNNLDFPIKFNKRENDTPFRCHRGFLRVWNSIKPYLEKDILDSSVKKIIISGFSHGAGIAILCYEYVWYHRSDLRNSLEGYGFGGPRVLWGKNAKGLAHRWENFIRIKNIDDLITHLPPSLFGYFHVGKLLKIGSKGKYSKIDAHRPESYLKELKAQEHL